MDVVNRIAASTGASAEGPTGPYVVILGTNEIASAIAIALRHAGGRVVLAHDPTSPVLRRGMAFHDALFGDPAVLDGVEAARADTTLEVNALMGRGAGVVVTGLGLLDLITVDRLEILIDARLQSTTARPDLRWLARTSVGLGPGFLGQVNCDVAVGLSETVAELSADGAARHAVRSAARGVWRTPVEIGAHVFKGFVVGHLDGAAIHAPFDGVIAGAVRDGAEVAAGVDLVEIDRRVKETQWRGVDGRGAVVARAVLAATETHMAVPAPGHGFAAAGANVPGA